MKEKKEEGEEAKKKGKEDEKEGRGGGVCWLVACLLNVPATCECISGTDLFRQIYVLPH